MYTELSPIIVQADKGRTSIVTLPLDRALSQGDRVRFVDHNDPVAALFQGRWRINNVDRLPQARQYAIGAIRSSHIDGCVWVRIVERDYEVGAVLVRSRE